MGLRRMLRQSLDRLKLLLAHLTTKPTSNAGAIGINGGSSSMNIEHGKLCGNNAKMSVLEGLLTKFALGGGSLAARSCGPLINI